MEFLERFSQAGISALDFHFQRYAREWIVGIIALLTIGLSCWLLIAPPAGFPIGGTIVITSGTGLPGIAAELAQDRIIAHPRLFELLIRATGTGTRLKSGPYRFAAPANVLTVALRLIRGQSGIPDIRITFIEGESVREMSLQVSRAFADISASDFIAAAGPYEGTLFPDTYRFAPSASPDDIVTTMQSNFSTKIASIEPLIQNSGHSLSSIEIMASIVQDEASDPATQKIVAGILWNRIARTMPLQVDATFGYLEDEPEHAPTLAELSINSPYNTYKYAGLPPTPIGNPGLSALEAAADPTQSNYLYYLTGSDGQMYYATTYAGQLANERKYLP